MSTVCRRGTMNVQLSGISHCKFIVHAGTSWCFVTLTWHRVGFTTTLRHCSFLKEYVFSRRSFSLAARWSHLP